MRLIDADELKKTIEQGEGFSWDSYGKDDLCVRKKYIDNAPTVDITETISKFRNTAYQNGLTTGLNKRTQCEWLYPDADIVIGKRRIGRSRRVCSNCKESFSNNIPWDANYCPNCGAEVKMHKMQDMTGELPYEE